MIIVYYATRFKIVWMMNHKIIHKNVMRYYAAYLSLDYPRQTTQMFSVDNEYFYLYSIIYRYLTADRYHYKL